MCALDALSAPPGRKPELNFGLRGAVGMGAADIGNNNHDRSEVQIYRIPEPSVPAGGQRITDDRFCVRGVAVLHHVAVLAVRYPESRRWDSEAFFVDPIMNHVRAPPPC